MIILKVNEPFACLTFARSWFVFVFLEQKGTVTYREGQLLHLIKFFTLGHLLAY